MNDLIDNSTMQDDTPLGEADLPNAVYDSFRSRGLSHEGALAVTAEVGRENNFQSKWLFGIHSDPANQATNIGMFSWQKDRATALRGNLESLGLVEGDRIKNTRRSIDAMVDFSLQELDRPEYGGGTITQALKGNIDRTHAAELLGRKYIKWAYDNPVYASGHKNRDFWYDKIAKQKGQGLDEMPQRPATMFDSPRELERTTKPLQPVTEGVGFFTAPSVSASYQASYNRYEGKMNEVREKYLNDAFDQIETLSGIERPSDWKYSMLNALPRWVSNISPDVLEKARENRYELFNNYIKQVQEQRPDLNLPFQSSMDLDRLAVQEIIGERLQGEEALSNLYDQGGFINDSGVFIGSMIGGMGAFLSDWENVKTTIATAAITGGRSLVGQVVAGVVVNAGQELYADVLARRVEEKLGIERTTEETLEAVGTAAAVGAAVPVLGRGIKAAYVGAKSALKPKIKAEVNEVLADATGVNPDANPFGDSDIGAAKYDAHAQESINTFEATGEAPTPVGKDMPAVYDDDVAKAIEAETSSFDVDMRKVLAELEDPELLKIYDDLVKERTAEIEAAPKVGRQEYEELLNAQTPDELKAHRDDMTMPAEDEFKKEEARRSQLVEDIENQAPKTRNEKSLYDRLDEIESNEVMSDVEAIEKIRSTKNLSEEQIVDLNKRLADLQTKKDATEVIVEDINGNLETITTKELRARIKSERIALEAITSCAASIGV